MSDDEWTTSGYVHDHLSEEEDVGPPRLRLGGQEDEFSGDELDWDSLGVDGSFSLADGSSKPAHPTTSPDKLDIGQVDESTLPDQRNPWLYARQAARQRAAKANTRQTTPPPARQAPAPTRAPNALQAAFEVQRKRAAAQPVRPVKRQHRQETPAPRAFIPSPPPRQPIFASPSHSFVAPSRFFKSAVPSPPSAGPVFQPPPTPRLSRRWTPPTPPSTRSSSRVSLPSHIASQHWRSSQPASSHELIIPRPDTPTPPPPSSVRRFPTPVRPPSPPMQTRLPPPRPAFTAQPVSGGRSLTLYEPPPLATQSHVTIPSVRGAGAISLKPPARRMHRPFRSPASLRPARIIHHDDDDDDSPFGRFAFKKQRQAVEAEDEEVDSSTWRRL